MSCSLTHSSRSNGGRVKPHQVPRKNKKMWTLIFCCVTHQQCSKNTDKTKKTQHLWGGLTLLWFFGQFGLHLLYMTRADLPRRGHYISPSPLRQQQQPTAYLEEEVYPQLLKAPTLLHGGVCEFVCVYHCFCDLLGFCGLMLWSSCLLAWWVSVSGECEECVLV